MKIMNDLAFIVTYVCSIAFLSSSQIKIRNHLLRKLGSCFLHNEIITMALNELSIDMRPIYLQKFGNCRIIEALPDGASRTSPNDGIGLHVMSNNGTRGNNCTLAYGHSIEDERVQSNPHVIPYNYPSLT